MRVLQEKQFQRVGGSRTLQVDVRVIAASNKDLEAEIANGTFGKIFTTGSTWFPSRFHPCVTALKTFLFCWMSF